MTQLRSIAGAFLCALLLVSACGDEPDDNQPDPATCEQGTLGCQCIDGRSCSEGLVCESGLCVEDEPEPDPCEAGTTGMPGSCVAILCDADERVIDNACQSCPVGTTNTAGDDASGDDTTCDPVTCAADEAVRENVCVMCAAGTTNQAGDDASGADTECDPVECEADRRVVSNVCEACPPGTSNEAGDDASGADTECEATACEADQRVIDNACVPCPNGSTNMAGDDASGDDTTCDGEMCPSNQRVEANECVGCPAGTTNGAGDDASGPDTTCDPVTCEADESVQANSCVDCPAGTTNDAGDDASGPDTTCDAVFCGADQFVQSNQCMACPAGATNDAGDDASGPDTVCDDACSLVLGLTCADVSEAYSKASNPGVNDNFGWSVAVSGDVMAVGARLEDSCADGVNPATGQNDNGCSNSGAVYIFERDGQTGTWTQVAYVKASNSSANDFFGSSIAVSGSWMAVGAELEASCSSGVNSGGQADDACVGAGAVYLYERDQQTGDWSQAAYIKASNPDSNDRFGTAVSLSGDRLLVGSPREGSCDTGVNAAGGGADNVCGRSGAAYLFDYDSQASTWSQTAYLKASNTDTSDSFGGSVSVDGDRLIVGAVDESSCATGVNPVGGQSNNGCLYVGAAYLFERDAQTGVWAQTTYLKASNAEALDDFGNVVAISGDIAAVSSLGEDSCADGVNPSSGESDNGCSGAGAVYLFERNSQTGFWSQVAYVKASNSETSDSFGHALDLRGARLAVAADREASCFAGLEPIGGPADNGCSGAGAVYLFERDTVGNWTQILYMKSEAPEMSDQFGYSLALDDTFLAVGAFSEDSCGVGINPAIGPADNACAGAGSTYIYRVAP